MPPAGVVPERDRRPGNETVAERCHRSPFVGDVRPLTRPAPPRFSHGHRPPPGGTVRKAGGRPVPSPGARRTIGSFVAPADAPPMASIFGRSEDQQERLRATVRSLGVTSVPGLAAALSLRERKTEKLLAHELARPGTQIVYEPSRRLVRWRRPLPPPSSPPSTEATPVAPALERPSRDLPGPAPVLRGTTLKTLCPSCHVALLATGSGKLAVCPECGRLSSEKVAELPSAPPAPSASPTAAAGPAPLARPPDPGTDRRSQELFAAYVTARPIPCPKCRTPLRHRAVAEYACPSCGQSVRFPKAAEGGPPVLIRSP